MPPPGPNIRTRSISHLCISASLRGGDPNEAQAQPEPCAIFYAGLQFTVDTLSPLKSNPKARAASGEGIAQADASVRSIRAGVGPRGA